MINYSPTAVNNLAKGKSRITPSTAALICNTVNAMGKEFELDDNAVDRLVTAYRINPGWFLNVHEPKFDFDKQIQTSLYDLILARQMPQHIKIERCEDGKDYALYDTKTGKACSASTISITKMLKRIHDIECGLWETFFDIQNNE